MDGAKLETESWDHLGSRETHTRWMVIGIEEIGHMAQVHQGLRVFFRQESPFFFFA